MNTQTAALNAKLALASSFLYELAFTLPIWLLYSLNVLHFSPVVAVVIFLSLWSVSALLEVPTGALADRLGRKKVFMAGQILFAAHLLAYAFEFPIVALVACCLVSALGNAMRSGAVLPIVHQSYQKAGLGRQAYENFLSTNQVIGFLGRACSGAAGAALYSVNPKWPFLAMCIVALLSFLVAFWFKEAPASQRSAHSNTEQIRRTLRLIKQSPNILVIIASFAIFDLAASVIWTGYQVFFSVDGRSELTIGLLFSIIAGCSALGAYAVRFISTRLDPKILMYGFGVGILLTATLLAQPNPQLRLLAIVPMGLMSGTTLFTLNAVVQRELKNRYHSTGLSVVSFVQFIAYAAGSLVFAGLAHFYSNATLRYIIVGYMACALTVLGFYLLKRTRLPAIFITAKGSKPLQPENT